MDALLNKAVKVAIILTAAVFIILLLAGKFKWAFGLLTGSAWATVNFLLLINLLKTAILRAPKKVNLFIALLVKFPVLYLTGFLILNKRYFPVSSLVVGLALILIVMGTVKIWPKRI